MTEYVRLGVTSQLLRTYLHIAAAHGYDYTDLGVHPNGTTRTPPSLLP